MNQMFSQSFNHLDDLGILALLLEDTESARRLLACYESFPRLRQGSWMEWVQVAKISEASAQMLAACLELAVRSYAQPWALQTPLKSSQQVFESVRFSLGSLPVEAVWIVLLDTRLRNMGHLEISRGSVGGAVAHPREILKPVILRQAYGFILLHNHPSGDPTPSSADLTLTRRLSRLAKDLHVGFLDHLIVTPTAFHSFADHGQL